MDDICELCGEEFEDGECPWECSYEDEPIACGVENPDICESCT